MRKLFKIISWAVVTLLIVIAALLVIPAIPVEGNYQIRVVLSGSMEPTIPVGSLVFVKPAATYNVGDVITFTSGSFRDESGKIVPVTHRIIEIKNEGSEISYATKGDANDSSDPNTTSEKNVLGKVFLTIPYAGYAVENIRKPYGFLALILIPAVIIIIDQIKNIVVEAKKLRQKRAAMPEDNIEEA